MTAIPSSFLPDELHLQVLSYLTPQEITQSSRVCLLWHRLAFDKSLWDKFDLMTVFPQPVRVIDEKVWAEYANIKVLSLNFEGIPPLDNRAAIPELGKFFRRLKEQGVSIENDAGVTLLSFSKQLTSPKLTFIAQNEKGQQTIFRDQYATLHTFSGAVAKRLLITNGVLRGDSTPDRLLQKMGCRRPKALEAASLSIMTLKSTEPPLVLLPTGSSTLCQESIDDLFGVNVVERSLLIGGDLVGFRVHIEEPGEESKSMGVCDFDGTQHTEEKA